jgi:hypothetical protein
MDFKWLDYPSTLLVLGVLAAGLCYTIHSVSYPRAVSGPPNVPYLVPWLGSALSMGKEPDGFFRQAT